MADFRDTHRDETFKSLVPMSIEVLKISVFLNGGAAVAILAFLGNVISKPSADTALSLGPSLRLFAGGAVLGSLAFAFAYLCQLALFNEDVGFGPGNPRNPRGVGFLLDHRGWLWLAIGCVLSSLGCFLRGCWAAAAQFPY
jgi:hypothetical protein